MSEGNGGKARGAGIYEGIEQTEVLPTVAERDVNEALGRSERAVLDSVAETLADAEAPMSESDRLAAVKREIDRMAEGARGLLALNNGGHDPHFYRVRYVLSQMPPERRRLLKSVFELLLE